MVFPGAFLIARNPDPASTLPYLLHLPLPGAPLVLKTADTWPRTSKVYCHRAGPWPQEPELIDQVPVRLCQRRGVAIELVLDRPSENHSQLVFTLEGGWERILWQSPHLIRQPRKPREVVILVDTQERHPYRFNRLPARTEWRPLPAGHYGVDLAGEIVGTVERVSLATLATRLFDGRITDILAELALVRRGALVVEDRYREVLKLNHLAAGFGPDLLAAAQVRFPDVPIAFCDTRPVAEEWTYRFLAAALASARAETDTAEPRRRALS